MSEQQGEWTPPTPGMPCWFQIPATDVLRAREFYSQVFNWAFKAGTEQYPTEEISLFSFPEKACPASGGIVKTKESEHAKGPGGVLVYIYTDDLTSTMANIVKHGGKKCSDVVPEGNFGEHMAFDDTEGNRLAIYSTKK